jgi:hypothetical protein
MPVQLRCGCGKLLRVRDELFGKRVKCPGCGAPLPVQSAPLPHELGNEALQQTPPPRPLRGPALEPERAIRRGVESYPERAPYEDERPLPRPKPKPAQGNLALWLAIGGVGVAAAVAVVLFITLSSGKPLKEQGGAGAGPGPVQPGGVAPLQPPGRDEGFITTWLLLAPIPLGGNESPAEAVGKEQIKGEAMLRPRVGDMVRVGDKELVWQEYRARDYFFDFNDFLGGQTEDSVGYAVCYIRANTELRGVQLRTGSDDQARIYLNGREVFRQDQARALMKDQDTTEVTLNRGMNVLVFKVINEKLDWSGCARFTDRDGNTLRDLKISTTPE